jgi:hypothetical protein
MRAPTKEPDAKAPFDGDPLMHCFARAAPSATFSVAQWRKIADCLDAVGVNLDTQTVEELAGPREWWGAGKDYTPTRVPLRYALQEWAYAYAASRIQRKKALTPNQYAKKLRDEVIALEETRASAMVDPNHVGPGLPTDEVSDARFKHRRVPQAGLAQEIAERREYIAELEAAGRSSNQNARTKAAEYWDISRGNGWRSPRARSANTRGNISLIFCTLARSRC